MRSPSRPREVTPVVGKRGRVSCALFGLRLQLMGKLHISAPGYTLQFPIYKEPKCGNSSALGCTKGRVTHLHLGS